MKYLEEEFEKQEYFLGDETNTIYTSGVILLLSFFLSWLLSSAWPSFLGAAVVFPLLLWVNGTLKEKTRQKVVKKASRTPMHIVNPDSVLWRKNDVLEVHGFQNEKYNPGCGVSIRFDKEKWVLKGLGAFGGLVLQHPEKDHVRLEANIHSFVRPSRTKNLSLEKRKKKKREEERTKLADQTLKKLEEKDFLGVVERARREVMTASR